MITYVGKFSTSLGRVKKDARSDVIFIINLLQSKGFETLFYFSFKCIFTRFFCDHE